MPVNRLAASIARVMWWVLVALLILVAIYVSVGRMVMPRLENYQTQIEQWLGQRLQLEVSAESFAGGWQGLNPTLRLRKVALQPSAAEAGEEPLRIQHMGLELDTLASLFAGQLVFSSLSLEGAELALEQSQSGGWGLAGLQRQESAPESWQAPLFDWLLVQPQLALNNLTLNFYPHQAPPQQLRVAHWGLRCSQGVCASQGLAGLQAKAEPQIDFAFNLMGHPQAAHFSLQGYLRSAAIELAPWISLFAPDRPLLSDLDQVVLGGEVWFDWQARQLLDARGTLNLPKLTLQSDNDAIAAIDALQTDFSWQRHSGNTTEQWTLQLNDLTFSWAGRTFAPAQRRISMQTRPEGPVLRLLADRVALEPLASTLSVLDALPDKVREVLRTLEPGGQLRNVHLDYWLPQKDKAVPAPRFDLQARLDDVSVSAWENAPAGQGINGYLEVRPEGGLVDFASNNFQLHFPRLYDHAWQFQAARGVVHWQRDAQGLWLRGEKLRLAGPMGKLSGAFGLETGKHSAEPRLSLLIGLEQAQLPEALTLMPDYRVAPQTVTWLDRAFDAGKVLNSRFILDYALRRGAPEQARSLAIEVEAEALDFTFHPDWPPLRQANARMQLRDEVIDVQASQAQFLGVALQGIEARYTARPGDAKLDAHAQMQGTLANAWRSLTETPLQDELFELASDFQFGGDMAGQLTLSLPFARLEHSDVNVAFRTANGALSIPSVGVAAESIKGRFEYSREQGLSAKQVSAQLFGQSAQLQIGPVKSGRTLATRLQVQGAIGANELSPWVPVAVGKRLQGDTAFQAELLLGKGVKNYLLVRSDLQGLAVDLPAPLGKPAQQAAPFSLRLPFTGPPIHTLRYADRFGYALRLTETGYRDGQITLGPVAPAYAESDGIRVKGRLQMLDFADWQAALDRLQTDAAAPGPAAETGAQSLVERITRAQIDVRDFYFLDRQFEDVIFNVTQHDGNWQVGFDTAQAKGVLDYYKSPQRPMSVSFEHLTLPSQAPEGGQAGLLAPDGADVLARVVPQDIPALDVVVDQLRQGEAVFGTWRFKLRPHAQGVSLEQLAFELRGAVGEGKLVWLQRDGQHSSRFAGSVRIPAFAEMLKQWGKPPAVEAKNTVLKGTLNWPGSPANFSLLETQGEVSLKSREGRIEDMKSFRLLGVLNFNTLSRRLRLDFSDLFKKGYSFERVEGKLRFAAGTLVMAESLIIDGPSVKYKIDGRTDLVDETFDQNVIVVLPVTDNLPVIAAIAGFPQVGIPMYLFNRAFGDIFDRFTSVNYRVTGSWDDPEIELDSFFDTRELNGPNDSDARSRLRRHR